MTIDDHHPLRACARVNIMNVPLHGIVYSLPCSANCYKLLLLWSHTWLHGNTCTAVYAYHCIFILCSAFQGLHKLLQTEKASSGHKPTICGACYRPHPTAQYCDLVTLWQQHCQPVALQNTSKPYQEVLAYQ